MQLLINSGVNQVISFQAKIFWPVIFGNSSGLSRFCNSESSRRQGNFRKRPTFLTAFLCDSNKKFTDAVCENWAFSF